MKLSSIINTNEVASRLIVDISSHSPKSIAERSSHWLEKFEQILIFHVDNHEQFQFCAQHVNFSIKGSFSSRPLNIKTHKVTTNYQALLQLLVELQDHEISPDQRAETINQNSGLGHKLLRLKNSAFFDIHKKINSSKQAIVLLGITKIKTWVSMLALIGVEDKPFELKHTAMLQTKMCELLAQYYKGDADTFFAAGLFSSIDALTWMDEVNAQMSS